ncbi:unnamed protein product [Tilletia laevis]|uniref:Uncharacterized protein n=2 Tax=Tilletia TaxID=13289 RepID=A0A177V7S7_9BASI|nr:hypothetical protein CF336_g1703 [Tilletia laevis]KAE8264025.1 hypothetical protein A4X03_0g1245 [Tilletia caries]KAE8206285.1 hypothetical protein CF335_g2010 [Tilletia laevis]CAD6884653.1 unnamed protein product [Tilletia caries]CAD6896762.1 unnamed protein product [Tilletia laevis]
MIRLSTINGVLRTLVQPNTPAPTATATATDDAPPPASSSSSHQHPHTALILIAHSGQVYSSATTLPIPSPQSHHQQQQQSQPQRHPNGLFVNHPQQSPGAPTDHHSTLDSPSKQLLPSLVGDERIRVLAGLATSLWREELMNENPAVPYLVPTELGTVLVQPLGGGRSAGFPLSPQNSPPTEDHFQPQQQQQQYQPSSDSPSDSTFQQAQRRRAASIRTSRLLLVLNSSPPSPKSETDEGTTASDEAAAALETLISVASAGAQHLSPALASLVQA